MGSKERNEIVCNIAQTEEGHFARYKVPCLTILVSLKRGEKVSIVGFGNFSVSERKATTGRNPRTGESIQIPASKRPKFSVGKALKDAVNV